MHPLAPKNPLPRDWPRITSSLFYDDASAAIDWLCKAFGFEVRLRIEGEGGRIEHSELDYGDGLIMVGSAASRGEGDVVPSKSPTSAGGVTQALCIVVDDVDAHCAYAREQGAKIHTEPKTDDYGEDYWADRTYAASDPEGHFWWFLTRIRDKKA